MTWRCVKEPDWGVDTYSRFLSTHQYSKKGKTFKKKERTSGPTLAVGAATAASIRRGGHFRSRTSSMSLVE